MAETRGAHDVGIAKTRGDGMHPEHRGTAMPKRMSNNDTQGKNPTDRDAQTENWWQQHRQNVLAEHGLGGDGE